MKTFILAALLAISSTMFAQQGGYTGSGSGAPVTCTSGTYVCIGGATLTGGLQAPVLNGLTNASLPASSDIGPAVNAAFASLGSTLGTVIVDPTQKSGGLYNQQTTIHIPLGDVLDCQGAELFWNVTTGEQFHYGSAVANSYLLGGIRNCRLGSGSTANATTSIYAGGDPNGVITPSNTYGNFMFVEDTSVFGFGTGITHGSNFWAGKFDNVSLFGNYDNVLSAPANATNMGEATVIKSSKIFNAVHCGLNLNNTSDVYYVDAGSIDYNGNQGVGAGVCGTAATVTLHDVWEEQPYGPFINITGTTGLNVVRVNGGHAIQSTYANTITNVAITSNVLSLTITGTTTFYAVNMPLVLTGLTTATFLNNQSVTVTAFNSGTGVITAAFSHADYASTVDTGTTTPTAPDLWHVEGVFGSYANIQDVTSQSNGAFYTLGVGVGSGTNVRVCVSNTSGVHQFLAVPTNIVEGCTYSVPFRIQFNNSIASFSPDPSGLQTAGQGWNLQWNVHLAGLTGETDFVNVRGVGIGGWAWCDGANAFVPTSACTASLIQMYLNGTTGELYLPKSMTASQLVATDANKGLVSTLALPAGVTATAPGAADNSTFVPTTAWIQTNTATLLGPYATTSSVTSAVNAAIAALTFAQIGTGTNTAGTLTCSTGCTITTAGSGAINATALGGLSQFSYAKLGAANSYTQAGALSTPAATYTGAPIGTGGTGTTTVPLFYFNAGAAPTSWNTAGTILGMNAPSGFTGNCIDFHLNGGASLFSVNCSTGTITTAGSLFAGSTSLTAVKTNSGATFTASGCSVGTLTGNSTSGTFASGTTGTCTVTVTMGASQSAAKDWSCSVRDTTTPADAIVQTGVASTTTATFTGTTVSGDVISFACIGHA